jgi:hypothetical protein
VSTEVDADPAALFAVLRSPSRHVEIDGSGSLQVASGSEVLRGVGDVFSMAMDFAPVGRYEVDNHVVAFEQDRHLAWMPARPGVEPIGVRWDWTLTVLAGGGTRVTQTCDWSRVTDEAYLESRPLPRVSEAQMRVTIERLVRAAEAG